MWFSNSKSKTKGLIGLNTSIALAALLTASQVFAGAGSSGGGNGVNGRPIESYAVKISETTEYRQFILPVLEIVSSKLPDFAKDLKSTAIEKPWYFVPVTLDQLPSNLIGVAFPTDQDALQSQGAVWIDKNRYDSMKTASDRAHLLVHEMIMGIALAKRNGRTLDAEAYDQIRGLVVRLFNLRNEDDSKELQQAVNVIGRPEYRLALPTDIRATMSLDEFGLFLEGQNQMQTLPGTWARIGHRYVNHCAYVAQRSAQENSFSFGIGPDTNLIGSKPDRMIVIRSAPSVKIYPTYIEYQQSEVVVNPKPGDHRGALKIAVNGDFEVIKAAAYEEVYVFNPKTREFAWTPDVRKYLVECIRDVDAI
jgi:hypothetical protein